MLITVWRLAFVADFGTQNFNLKTKFDMENKTLINHENGNDANRLLDAVVSNMDIETAAVNAYKGKDLNEQRKNIDKILAFEKGAKWVLSKLSNNGS